MVNGQWLIFRIGGLQLIWMVCRGNLYSGVLIDIFLLDVEGVIVDEMDANLVLAGN
jgi:hypothetical protein